MPSPFPGMDPFIENQAWADFHHELISVIREHLTPPLLPRYIVRVEERVYLEHLPEEYPTVIRPDVTVGENQAISSSSSGMTATALEVEIVPVLLTLPIPEPQKEAFLTIRLRDTMEVVAIIEVLSPGNKRSGSDGRREYLSKREAVLLSPTHLIELDLLRGGERLPTVEPLPPADYYAFVCRGNRRPKVGVYYWSVREALPSIPVPLAGKDPDVWLNLQAVFNTVYERARYDYSLDYRHPVEPALSEEDTAWVQPLLASIQK